MAFIIEQFVGDRAIQLGNEEYVRPMSFGTDWQKVRLGVHWATYGLTAPPAGVTPRLGFCVGNIGWFGTPVDAFSYPFFGVSAPTYTGTPPNAYYQSNSGTQIQQQNVGGVITNASTYASAGNSISVNPTLNRSMWFMTLTKGITGNSNITCQYGGNLTSQANTDVSRSAFLSQMESESVAVSGLTMGASTGTVLTSGVYTKLWDSILVNWNRCVPALTIYEVCVVRYA